MIDSYFALFYLSIHQIPDDEREFRKIFWEYQSERKRLKLLKSAGFKSPQVDSLQQEVAGLLARLKAHAHFEKIDGDGKDRFKKVNSPLLVGNARLPKGPRFPLGTILPYLATYPATLIAMHSP